MMTSTNVMRADLATYYKFNIQVQYLVEVKNGKNGKVFLFRCFQMFFFRFEKYSHKLLTLKA